MPVSMFSNPAGVKTTDPNSLLPTAQPADYAPFGFGNTDPTGDVRRAVATSAMYPLGAPMTNGNLFTSPPNSNPAYSDPSLFNNINPRWGQPSPLASTQTPGVTTNWSAAPSSSPQQIFNAPTTTGGGSLNPTTPNIFLPPPFAPGGGGSGGGTNPFTQMMTGGRGGFNNGFTGGSPDQFLADYTNNTGFLTNIASNAGFPTSVGPAWDAMIAAQQRNIDRGAADLSAGFAASGNRFSSDYGNAAVDYQTQARANQNSLLGQMTMTAQEQARQRELAASGQLAQQGFQGGQQLSSQDFQSLMQSGQFGQNDLNRQLQASLAFMNSGYGASSQLAGFGAQGAQGLQAGSLTGAGGLYGTSNSTAQQEIQRQLMLQQMQLGGAQTASQLWQSNLGLGNQIGQGQFQAQTAQAQAAFQEWLRTQPQYNPLLQMMFSGATGYPQVYQPQYQPSQVPAYLSAFGSIAGALPGIIKASDRRLKYNIRPFGVENGFNIYKFNFIGEPNNDYIGVIADEIAATNPEAIVPFNNYLAVDYSKLGVQFRRAA